MNSSLRILSIIAYLLIFLKGDMIALPLVMLLVLGPFSSAPVMTVLLILADIALVRLLIHALAERTKWTTAVEVACFVALLLPLLKLFFSFSFEWFNNVMFLLPFTCFICLFPLSIMTGHRNYKKLLAKG